MGNSSAKESNKVMRGTISRVDIENNKNYYMNRPLSYGDPCACCFWKKEPYKKTVDASYKQEVFVITNQHQIPTRRIYSPLPYPEEVYLDQDSSCSSCCCCTNNKPRNNNMEDTYYGSSPSWPVWASSSAVVPYTGPAVVHHGGGVGVLGTGHRMLPYSTSL